MCRPGGAVDEGATAAREGLVLSIPKGSTDVERDQTLGGPIELAVPGFFFFFFFFFSPPPLLT